MKKLLSIIAYGITDLEKVIFWHTGKILPLLECRFIAERIRIQALLDAQHDFEYA